MRTIVVHGASTAAGWFDMEHAGWANRLHLDALNANIRNPKESVVIHNNALPGNTLPGVLNDITAVERYRRLGRVTSILAIGLNESKIMNGSTRPLVSLGKFRDSLGQYGEYMSDRSIGVVYVGVEMLLRSTIVTENGNTFEDDLTQEYDDLIRRQAQDYGMPYVSVHKAFTTAGANRAVSSDGYHPNAFGHAILHEEIAEALRPFESFQSIHTQNDPITPDITGLLTARDE